MQGRRAQWGHVFALARRGAERLHGAVATGQGTA